MQLLSLKKQRSQGALQMLHGGTVSAARTLGRHSGCFVMIGTPRSGIYKLLAGSLIELEPPQPTPCVATAASSTYCGLSWLESVVTLTAIWLNADAGYPVNRVCEPRLMWQCRPSDKFCAIAAVRSSQIFVSACRGTQDTVCPGLSRQSTVLRGDPNESSALCGFRSIAEVRQKKQLAGSSSIVLVSEKHVLVSAVLTAAAQSAALALREWNVTYAN